MAVKTPWGWVRLLMQVHGRTSVDNLREFSGSSQVTTAVWGPGSSLVGSHTECLLPTDVAFITTVTFLWKVSAITVVSCLPLYVLKYLKRKLSPPSYSKLTSWGPEPTAGLDWFLWRLQGAQRLHLVPEEDMSLGGDPAVGSLEARVFWQG